MILMIQKNVLILRFKRHFEKTYHSLSVNIKWFGKTCLSCNVIYLWTHNFEKLQGKENPSTCHNTFGCRLKISSLIESCSHGCYSLAFIVQFHLSWTQCLHSWSNSLGHRNSVHDMLWNQTQKWFLSLSGISRVYKASF